MRTSIEVTLRSLILVIAGFLVKIGVNLAVNSQQFQIINAPLPPILFTVQLFLEYIPAGALISIGCGGFYIALMSWKPKRDESGAGTVSQKQ